MKHERQQQVLQQLGVLTAALPVSCGTHHVFPPHWLTVSSALSQTNTSFLCEHWTFDPSETRCPQQHECVTVRFESLFCPRRSQGDVLRPAAARSSVTPTSTPTDGDGDHAVLLFVH